MKRVVIHIDHDGEPNFLVEIGAGVQVLVIDERAPSPASSFNSRIQW
jgi:hypothetical protein